MTDTLDTQSKKHLKTAKILADKRLKMITDAKIAVQKTIKKAPCFYKPPRERYVDQSYVDFVEKGGMIL